MKQADFTAALKMVSHAAALKDIRYYLNGVRLEWDGLLLSMIGTDGHRMAVAQLQYGEKLLEHPKCVTVPPAQVKLLLSAPKTTGDAELNFSAEDRAEISIGCQAFSIQGVGGKYPDWRRVGPEKAVPSLADSAVSSIGFKAPYMAEACAALAKVANKKYQGVKLLLSGPSQAMRLEAGLAGDHPSLVNAYAIIMPMRT